MRLKGIPDPRGPLRSTRDQVVEGIFGRHTALVDFCEENYAITPFIAEFWNTISNGAYIILGALGLHYAKQENLPPRVMACHWALIVLGIGSAIFHATLMKTAMMMDDLPMMWLVSVLVYCTVHTDPTTSNLPLIALLVTLNLIVIACDLAEVNQVYHYTIFGLLGAGAAGRFLQLEYTHRNALSPAVRKKAVAYFFSGVALILAGFAIWNVDNIYCDNIQPYKARYGMPVALLLEGHVWWHILTALGEYLTVTAGACVILAIQEGHQDFDFGHGVLGLPYVKRTGPSQMSKKLQ
ncbi:alkaline phytoceramidase [Cystobasidium minutum MCA 4210]|uniref:alkaline phytoceramidase n=1 Tax=Cystobasidium minutum MCA 4210 TaxID=1397322 RepID=UPI0034CE1F52|eukprot:jgi/Rhomi1/110624/CE110623_2486